MKYIKIIGYYLLIPVLAVMLTACTREQTVYLDGKSAEQTTEAITPVNPEEPAFCYVYVCGAVKNPGVYQLPEGSRVSEALALAGGLTEEAASESYNLAEKVTDEQKIQILTAEEAAEQISESGQAENSARNADGRINLNTATAAELMTLPGIGQAKADSIITYREENGRFDNIEDIMKISGIKEGIFLKIKNSITVN